MIESVRETQKKYCSRAIVIAIFAGLFLIAGDYRPIGKGLILGTLFSVVNFVLIGETLPWRLGKIKSKTLAIALGSIIFRYALLVVPLILAAKMEQLNFAATVCGIFMVQMMIVVDHFRAAITSTFRAIVK